MPDSKVIHTLRSFRNNMNTREDQTMRSLGSSWLKLEQQLQGNIIALAKEMTLKREAGEVITEAMIRRAERYKILEAQLKKEIAVYNGGASKTITRAQENALLLGIDSAKNSIQSILPVADRSAFTHINIQAVESMIGFAGDGSPLRTLLKNDYGVASQGMLDALVSGISNGLGAEEVARNMRDGMAMGLDRSLLVARTELTRAYNAGSTEQYRQSGVVIGWMRLVSRDEACIACLALDGERFDTAQEMDDHPNGRCVAVPIIAGEPEPQWEKAQDWFAKQDEARQLEILGRTRLDMYKNGTPLTAFGEKIQNSDWGASPKVTTIADLLASGVNLPSSTASKDEANVRTTFDVVALRKEILKSNDKHLEKEFALFDARKTVENQRTEILHQIDALQLERKALNIELASDKSVLPALNLIEKKIDDLWISTHPLNKEISDFYLKEKALKQIMVKDARKILAVDNPINTKVLAKSLINAKKLGPEIDEVFKLVDADLIKGDNRVILEFKRGRAHYVDASNTITISMANAPGQTFAHEFGHFIEDEGHLRKVATDFLDSRTSGERARKLSIITGNKQYKSWEVAKPDDFFNPYVGKIYPSRNTEIISMGIERLYSDPVNFAKTDPEYFDFIVTLLRNKK